MNVKACPDDKHLAAHLLGRLHGARAEQLDSHLQVCDSCVERALKLKPEDTLTSALGDGVVDLSGDESVVLEIIEKAGALHAIVETSTGYETSSGQPNSGNSSATDISFLSPPQESDEIGRLGSYRVLEVLGIGGMGVVFRAEDPHLKRQIALKAMKPELAATPSAKERFLREARAVAAIEHDNIVTIYQVGEDRGVPFLAMRFLRGESLQTRLKRENRLSIKEVLRIGRETASGLAAAHARGLIHRDIKPDNMWLESRSHLRSDDEQGGGDSQELKVTSQSMEDVTRAKSDSQLTHEDKEYVDRVKIVDFGLVRADGDIELTKTGVVMGTPRYMSPEQAQGQPVDHRSDLFSLGSVLYHLTTGEGPFDRDNMPSTLMAVIREDPDRIENHRSDAPRELKGLIVRLLEKNPDDRPQSAAEVVAAVREIESILAEESKRAKTKRKPKVRPVKAPRAKKSGTRRRVVIGTAIVAPLLIVLGIVLLLRTPNGTLRVEVNDENLEVLVDGVQITLTDKKWAGKQKARKHRLAIKLGNQMLNIDSPTLIEVDDGEVERHLSVQLNGVDLSSNEFTVVRDGENVLTIAYEEFRIETVGQSDYEAVELKGTITPGDGWVDLLAAVDVRRDTTGSWRKDAGEFVGYGGLMLPVRPSGSFEWEVGFTHAATGDGLIDVLIPHPHGRVYARVTGETGLRLSAPADSEEESRSLIAAPAVSRGEPHTLKLTCDTRDDKTSIAILIDDKLWAEWAGDFRALTSRVPPMQHPYIHTGRQSITIRTARLRMLDGEARSDARTMPQQLDDLATGTWVPLFRSAEDLKLEGATKDRATWKDGIIDVVNTTKKTSYWSGVVKALAAPRGRNVILRAEVYFVYGLFASMSLSGSEEDIVRVSTTKSGYVLHRRDIRFNRDTNTLVPQSRKSRKGFRDVAIALIDGHAGLYLDGKLVLHRYGWSDEKRLPIIQAYDIGYQPGHAQFRNVRLMVLDNEATAETPSTAIAPFNATTAQERQKAWADFLGLPVEKEVELPGGEKMSFMLISPGEFKMGSTDEEQTQFRKNTTNRNFLERIPAEGPQHRVRITQPYYLGKFEVTQRQWKAVVGDLPSDVTADMLLHPVANVTWHETQEFLHRFDQALAADWLLVDLPTEAQWEFACRAGTTTFWHCSDAEQDLGAYAWYFGNAGGKVHVVGQLRANAFGLHDMHGNINEWCVDAFSETFYASSPIDDPANREGGPRVCRGGSFSDMAGLCRSAHRGLLNAKEPRDRVGFRLAMTIDLAQLKPKLTPTEILTSPDWEWTEPEPIAEVNSEAVDAFPTISGDGLTMVFVSLRGGQDEADLWISERSSTTDSWGEPRNLGPQVNSRFEDTPELSYDGLTLIFSQAHVGSKNGDLVVTTRSSRAAPWSKPVPIGGPINTSADEQRPSLSEDCLTLMFCSNRPGGIRHRKQPTYDLWISRRDTPEAPWKQPTNLGPSINTSIIEKGCSLSSDGLTLLFCNDDIKRATRSDRYMANRKSLDEPWSKPVRLPDIFQSESMDSDIELSSDGREVYVAGEDGDIYVIRRVPKRSNAADNDRRAAEYIVSVGGRFITDRSDQWTDVVPDSPFRLKGVSLAGRTVTDEELAAFQGCTELETLDLNRASVTDAGVIHFKNCKKLKELTLGTIVTDEGLANFQDCDRLESLTLICSTQKITDASLAFFKNCKELNHLHLHHANVGDAGLSHLRDCQKLAHLHLDRSNVTDTGLVQFKEWKELSTLVLSFTEVSDEGLAHLKDYPSLTSFSLMDAPHVSDAGLAHLQECKGLTTFVLRRSPRISADMVDRLKEALPNCRIDWDGESSANADAPPRAIAPFDAATAKRHQESWANHFGIPVRQVLDLGDGQSMTFAVSPPGEFDMGYGMSADELSKQFPIRKPSFFLTSLPQHRVRINRPFGMAVHEVTLGQFRRFISDTNYVPESIRDGKGGTGWDEATNSNKTDPKYTWEHTGWTQTDNHPATNVTWNDALAFCEWLTKNHQGVFRLPTEAEWEYACRAGTTSLFHNGDDPDKLADVGNVLDRTAQSAFGLRRGWSYIDADDGQSFTGPVGSYEPNA